MEEGITCLVLCPSTFDSPKLVWLMCTVLRPASRCRASTVLLDSAQCAECGRAAFIKNCCYIINKSIRNVGGQFVTASKKPPKYIHKKIHQPHCARQDCLSKHERSWGWEKLRCIQVHNVKHSVNTNTIQSKRLRNSACHPVAYSTEDQLLWRPEVLPVHEVEEFLLNAQRPRGQEEAVGTEEVTVQDNEQVHLSKHCWLLLFV